MSSQAWSSRASRESRLSRVEPNPPREAASLPRSRVRRPRSGDGAGSRSVGSRTVGSGARGSVSTGGPRSSSAGGASVVRASGPATGGLGGALTRRRRGRTRNVVPSPATTTTAMAMRMITSSITAPVWQTPQRASAGHCRGHGALRPVLPARTIRPVPTRPVLTRPARPEARSPRPQARPDRLAWSGALALAEPLADHGRDAVTAHADPVQRVGDLHGALLVGDDQELGRRPQLFENVQ